MLYNDNKYHNFIKEHIKNLLKYMLKKNKSFNLIVTKENLLLDNKNIELSKELKKEEISFILFKVIGNSINENIEEIITDDYFYLKTNDKRENIVIINLLNIQEILDEEKNQLFINTISISKINLYKKIQEEQGEDNLIINSNSLEKSINIFKKYNIKWKYLII